MESKLGTLHEAIQPEQQDLNAADADVWVQLAALASRSESDPVLHLLVGEAIARYEELRGVTATIASRYRALVDAVPDAVIIHDEAGNVLDANEAACQLYGKDRESILQSTLFVLNPELDADYLSRLHEEHQGGRSLTVFSTISREDGATCSLELHAREYIDAGRTRIIAVIRDLGERELALRHLRESETWLRSIMRDVDKGITVWDRRGQIMSANHAACRSLQMSESELRALASDQMEQWRYVDANGNSMEKSALPWVCALQTGKPHDSLICGLNLPGSASTLWFSASAIPQFAEDRSTPIRAAAVLTDITPLQRDTMMFAEVQSLNCLGAWQFDMDKDSLICSTQMHTILDVPMQTPITRQRMLEHFGGPDLDRFRLALTAAREGRPDQFEARLTTSIGRQRRVRIRVRPLHDGPRVRAIFGTFKDITSGSPHSSLGPSP